MRYSEFKKIVKSINPVFVIGEDEEFLNVIYYAEEIITIHKKHSLKGFINTESDKALTDKNKEDLLKTYYDIITTPLEYRLDPEKYVVVLFQDIHKNFTVLNKKFDKEGKLYVGVSSVRKEYLTDYEVSIDYIFTEKEILNENDLLFPDFVKNIKDLKKL